MLSNSVSMSDTSARYYHFSLSSLSSCSRMVLVVSLLLKNPSSCGWNLSSNFLSATGAFLCPAHTFRSFKGTVAWYFYVSFSLEWIYLGLNRNRFWFLNFTDAPSILENYFKVWLGSYQTFESPRRIDNWVWGSPINFICIATFLETRWCCWRTFLENNWISCQSFWEILRISKKYWHPLQRFSEDC
jgi:hypothetical protein